MKLLLTLALISLLAGCTQHEVKQPPIEVSPSPTVTPSQALPSPSASPNVGAVDCTMVETTEKLATNGGTVTFPKTGRFVVESHLMTSAERYSGKDGFPKKANEGIDNHVALHAAVLSARGADASKIYRKDYEREWTPAEEGGTYGQGSEEALPSIEEETFVANLPWKSGHPSVPPGTKYLLTNPANNKSVIVVMGYESGPTTSPKYLGGAQPAVHYFLGATGDTQLKVGKLKDQSVSAGPVKCK